MFLEDKERPKRSSPSPSPSKMNKIKTPPRLRDRKWVDDVPDNEKLYFPDVICCSCHKKKSKWEFTKSQWKNRPRCQRRCKNCTGEHGTMSAISAEHATKRDGRRHNDHSWIFPWVISQSQSQSANINKNTHSGCNIINGNGNDTDTDSDSDSEFGLKKLFKDGEYDQDLPNVNY